MELLKSTACWIFLVMTSGSIVYAGTCPDGWSQHEENCYLFKHETYNWFDAKTVCEILGGFLAEDTTQAVNEFLYGLRTSHSATTAVWIGLQDFAEENVFVWTRSKEKASLTFWLPTEPQDTNGEEDCVALYEHGWIDANCEDSRYHFICQRPATGDEIIG